MSGQLVLDEPIPTVQLVGAALAGALVAAVAGAVFVRRWLR